MKLQISLEAENLILDRWVAGTNVNLIERELRERGLQVANRSAPRPFSDSDIRNLVATARRRGDKRAVRRDKYATRISASC
jgi:hypothetical protein